jgi:hypothetical protein
LIFFDVAGPVAHGREAEQTFFAAFFVTPKPSKKLKK